MLLQITSPYRRITGTAYGLATAVQNIGLATFPVIVASLYRVVGSYANVEPFFAILGTIGTGIGIALMIWDKNNGGILKSTELKDPSDDSFNSLVETEEDVYDRGV